MGYTCGRQQTIQYDTLGASHSVASRAVASHKGRTCNAAASQGGGLKSGSWSVAAAEFTEFAQPRATRWLCNWATHLARGEEGGAVGAQLREEAGQVVEQLRIARKERQRIQSHWHALGQKGSGER